MKPTVVVDQQRVRAAPLGGDVVSGSQRNANVNLEVPDISHGHWLAAIDGRELAAPLSRLRWRERLGPRLPAALEQRQRQLHLRRQRFPIDLYGRLSGEAHLQAGRKSGEHLRHTVLNALTMRE